MAIDENDLRVLYCFTRWPRAPLKDICKALDMKNSAISYLKNRYLRSGIMRFERAVDPCLMGYEVRGVEYGVLRSNIDERSAKDHFLRMARENRSIFMFETDGNAFFSMLLSPTYIDYEKVIFGWRESCVHDGITGICLSGGYYDETRTNVLHNLRDYSGVLRYHFGTEVEADDLSIHDGSFYSYPNLYLNLNDPLKKALPHFVTVPPLSDLEISEKIEMSRQKVGKIRLHMENEGMLYRSYRLNMKHLGFTIRAHFVIEYDNDAEIEERIQYEEELKRRVYPVLWHSSPNRSNFIFYFNNIGEYKEFIDLLYGLMDDGPMIKVQGIPLSMNGLSATRYYDGGLEDTGHEWIRNRGKIGKRF